MYQILFHYLITFESIKKPIKIIRLETTGTTVCVCVCVQVKILGSTHSSTVTDLSTRREVHETFNLYDVLFTNSILITRFFKRLQKSSELNQERSSF